jgi:hypothetical protein
MKTRDEVEVYPVDPAEFHLICGHTLANKVGERAFNYYDMRWCEVRPGPHRPDVDTSGQLPNGVTYWFCDVDGSRACCVPCAKRMYPKRAI